MFVHLHCHSHYSFLRGVAPPEELIAAAAAQKMPTVALTDTNGLYPAVPFYQAAKKAGIQPIIGVVLDVSPLPELATRHSPLTTSFQETKHSTSATLTLLAMDMEGYSNLCQLTTLRHLGTTELAKNDLEECDGRPVTLEELARHAKGVIALCPLPTRLHDADDRRGTACRARPEWFAALKDIFGDRLWIEVQHLSPGDGRTLREAARIGRELGIPLVATNNVYFLRPEEHLHHRAVNAIRTGGLLTT